MNFILNNRTALITGGSKGIGKAIAEAFAAEGASVIITARSDAELSLAAQDIKKNAHGEVASYALDAIKSENVETMALDVKKKFGKLDILVNNVGGVERFGGFFDLTDHDWLNAYDLNFLSAVYFCRAFVPLLALSDCGRMVNISSLAAHQPGFFNPHYAAAKAALLNLNKYMSNTLAGDNILVNAICPSTVKGGGWGRNIADRAARGSISVEEAECLMEEEENKKSPLGRMVSLEDIAMMVLFLASPLNNSITGSVIDVDGGKRKGIS
ncbi:MAG: SDR family oxidoreductase [Candidatus Sungbacteria bacterium]|nr:SDR family oxidoreductase [Candidatus Sungbacteria bacterium]